MNVEMNTTNRCEETIRFPLQCWNEQKGAIHTHTHTHIGCAAELVVVVSGTPIGEPDAVQQYVSTRVTSTERCIDTLLDLPLLPQE
jgi:hypothetical protein